MTANGQLPDSALAYVAGHRVRADLVPQTVAMFAAAARDGVALRITQGYRPYAEQVSIFTARYVRQATGGGVYGDVRSWNGVRYVRRAGTAAAAVPGTSNHGLGQAIDFDTSVPGGLSWLGAHGPKFGWSRPAWTYQASTVEPWHWEAALVPVSNYTTVGGTVPVVPNLPPLNPLEEDDMDADQNQRLINVEGAVARLDAVFAPGGKFDTLLQYVTDVRGGVAGLPALLGSGDHSGALSALSDADVDRIAKHLLDEQARRLAQ